MNHDKQNRLNELRKELSSLNARRQDVLQEIAEIERTISKISNIEGALSNSSSVADKIKCFRNLFRGRDDVYARRFESLKTGKSGYQPACKNEWVRSVCLKPKGKCSSCSNCEYIPLTDDVIEYHLRGANPDEYGDKDFTIGIYPMLKDEKCWFIAADFDKTTWQEDIQAYVDTCRRFEISVSVERSRSGNGGHVWVFFAEPISCMKARSVGSYILTETMESRPELGLDSYDRFFPNQDTMTDGGFGNLIALPLQKKPRESGNSSFLDESFEPYADQWKYLGAIKKIDRNKVEELFKVACDKGNIVGLRLPSVEQDDEPWENTPSGRKKDNITGPFPDHVEIVLANQVFIPIKGLSPSLRNAIIRLAAFQNPEFYRNQAMRKSTYNTPRVISCAEYFDKYIGLPRGCMDDLLGLFKSINIRTDICDKQFCGNEIDIEFEGELYPEQQKAANALLKYNNGILAATTAFGKTVVASYVIAERKTNTLVLVHRRQLLEQWKARLSQFLSIDSKAIGQIGAGKRKPTGTIDIAVIQSLGKKGIVDDIVAEYGHLVIDECHHISAPSFESIARQFKGKYLTGLSATVARKDGHHPIIYMNCGPVRYTVSAKSQAKKRRFEHKLIVRETKYELSRMALMQEKITISDIYADLIDNIARNAMILEDVMESIYEGRFPVLLTERREHLDFFVDMLGDRIDNVVVLKGGMGKKQLAEVQKKLDLISEDRSNLVIATGRYLGEGFDHPRLDTLFLALPVSWKGTIAQYAGRLHRDHHSKSEVRIYDYADMNVPMLARMFDRRMAGYRAIGYELGK